MNDTPSAKPAPTTTGRFNLPGVIAVSVGHFIHDVYSGFLAPLLPLLIEKLSLSLTQAGLLSTAMQVPALINPWIGSLADRISVRWFLVLAPALTAVPMSLIGVAPTYAMLLVLMVFAGISASVFHVPAPVVVARMSGSRKGLGMSFFMVGGETARAVGPMVAVGIVALMGLDGFYPVMGVSFVCSGLLFVATRDMPLTQTAAAPVPLMQTWRSMRHILIPISGILVTSGFMYACMASFLPTFIAMNTGNIWLAGAGLTIFETAGVAGVVVAGSLSDRFGRRRMLAMSLIGAPVSLLGFVWVDGWAAYALLLLNGFTLLSTTPVMLALVQENAVTSPSAANGLFMMISFLSRSAVVVVVGMAGDLIGLKAAFVIFSVAGFIGLPFVFRLPAGRK
ncbi:MFS transporter [Desulfosarcina alkanivorans]|uniref:MFS transporter n=1 Tax=Desulfosarcina alkanivorans TaxID=571177 RepID=A0A5K7YC15_9BACT|nr:MFS transporter [Desulfosarcina alkanivorans]BBO66952.1 MFS transporter [Desulfosarcina alkanivorans]